MYQYIDHEYPLQSHPGRGPADHDRSKGCGALSVYNGIPHLLIPVVTDPKKAAGALNWAVAEMSDRYNKFAEYNVRDLKGYNAKVDKIKDIEEEGKPEKMPQIVIIVDELADLMMVAPGEVEDAICRLAQLARAAGIHLIIATQRPSGQCHHRSDQGKYAFQDRVLRILRCRLPDHHRHEWRGKAAGKRRHVILPTGLSEACPCSGGFCQ